MLFEACGPRPLWVMLDPAAARAALHPDGGGVRWMLVEGAFVRLRPGLGAAPARVREWSHLRHAQWQVTPGRDAKRMASTLPAASRRSSCCDADESSTRCISSGADETSLSLLLESEPAAAADANGEHPFELLPSSSSDDAATLLFKASGKPARPLWEVCAHDQGLVRAERG